MAGAKLNLPTSVKEKFVQAQNGQIRSIQMKIRGETFEICDTMPPTDDVEADFNNLQHAVQPDEATLFLFCHDTTSAALLWTLVAFVPDSASVRDRMMYASSRDSLKRELGYNYFKGEYQATIKEELIYAALQESSRQLDATAPLTEAEVLAKQEAALERDTNVKSKAMSVVPFQITPELKQELTKFQHQAVQVIKMVVDPASEAVEFANSWTDVSLEDLITRFSPESPCFIAYLGDKKQTYFIYSCPEASPVRLKMMYSTCKATLLTAAADLGVTFDRTLEIREPSEVKDALTGACASEATDAATIMTFAKPKAPARGRRGRGRGSLPKPTF